ncbi:MULTISPECIES: helix-turn-helix domain-containing protein [Clostridium]|jgi:transcriptional regulator with XRE-family HTH domain|uniref:Helix-turn-helix domain-containing protein n=1 Tax=Clostridium tertium TaxID=1559 RepID=A0A9X4B1N4_9CLOT|nr:MULTISPECIES: helix-turn-helix transcriptional regulator [Clostridium]MDC4242139.1 helix-turn-helix domain-containing protein [Clostridium tertium]MDU2155389.1 helix-turn-helix transcriptional regulator [Clostridium sp.]
MVGSKIAEIRNSKGISLSKLARDAGISKGYLSNIENGIKENPSVELLEKIASALGVNVSDLFDEEPIKNIEDELDILEEDMKILFSKAKQLSKENRKKVLKMIEIFEEENNN